MKKKDLIQHLILSTLSLLYLFFVLRDFPAEFSEQFMFMTPDSQEYLRTGQSFFDDSVNDALATRPFLFPLVLNFIHSIGGYLFWFVCQVAMWLLTINLLFATFKKLAIPILLNLVAIVCFCLNFTVIALLFHGLTEVTVIFLLSWLSYLIVVNRNSFFELINLKKVLLVLVVLTVVKPLFLLPTFAFLGLVIVLHFKSIFRVTKNLLVLVLIMLPIIVQMGLVKVSHDKFTFSEISSLTYRRYLFTQLYQLNHDCERDTALLIIEPMSSEKVKSISKENLPKLIDLYHENLKINLNGHPVFLELSKTKHNQYFVDKMIQYNDWVKSLYGVGIYWAIFYFLIVLLKKKFKENAGILFLAVMLFYIYFASGISAYQGDRLIIFALPLSIVFYIFSINYIYRNVFNGINNYRSKQVK